MNAKLAKALRGICRSGNPDRHAVGARSGVPEVVTRVKRIVHPKTKMVVAIHRTLAHNANTPRGRYRQMKKLARQMEQVIPWRH